MNETTKGHSAVTDIREAKRRVRRAPAREDGHPAVADAGKDAAPSWHIDGRDLNHDELLGCLHELTRLLGRPLTREALVAGLPLEDRRLTPRLFIRAANRAGFVARISKHAIDRRMAPLCPAVALLSDDRACIVTEIDRDRSVAKLVYPQAPGQFVEMRLQDLEAQSVGYVISVKNQYKFDVRAPELRTHKDKHWFWSTLFKPWRIYRDVLAASLLLNLFALAVPLFSMNVYDRVIPNSAFETLWTFTIGVVAVLGFDMLMKVLRAWFIDMAGKRVDQELAGHIMAKVLNLRLEARPQSVGSFAANLRAFESVREFLTSSSMSVLVDIPFAVIFLLVIGVIGGWLVLPPLLACMVVVGLGLLAQRKMKPLTDASQRASQQKNATLIEALVGLDTVKSLNIEGRTQQRWEQSNAFLAVTGGKIKLWSTIATQGTGLMTQLVTVGTAVAGVYLIADNQITMGALIACTQLAGRALAPMGQLASLMVQYDNTLTAFEGVNRIMDMPEERSADSAFVMRPQLLGGIAFDHVSFAYPNTEQHALEKASFELRPGERVALIGKVGSGKTTIEKLILGLYQPTRGTIRFDGVDAKQIDPAEVRRAVGYVSQDITLFFGTLRENIAIAAPWADDTRVLQAAALAGLGPLIQNHPQGINLHIGERGESLSGGQRQAVAIARALIAEPSILVLDEPTSAMDSDSEARVLESLTQFSRNRTLVLVTHRMSLLAMVDRIIVVDGGRIVADGPKERVLQRLAAA